MTVKLLHISIEYPVGLPGEQDGVQPQAQHEQDDQHLQIFNFTMFVPSNFFKMCIIKITQTYFTLDQYGNT